MSSKTVKVTNGKILNYTITADGYKTVNASKLITSNDTININMIAETDPNGVYSLGDRIGGCASFVCYFNSTNPETNVDQKYAVFVLDAAYRSANTSTQNRVVSPILTLYSISEAFNAKESSTYNTTVILSNYTDYDCFNKARSAAVLTLSDVVYASQLPNAYELKAIYDNRATLDSFDPTLSDYSTLGLNAWAQSAFCSTFTSDGSSTNYVINQSGNLISPIGGQTSFNTIPVFEIPVN